MVTVKTDMFFYFTHGMTLSCPGSQGIKLEQESIMDYAGTAYRQVTVLNWPGLGPTFHRLVALYGILLYLQGLVYDRSSLLLAGPLSISSRWCYRSYASGVMFRSITLYSYLRTRAIIYLFSHL